MRVTIMKEDNVVGINGYFINIPLDELHPECRVIQWNSISNKGHIEWADGSNTSLTSIDQYNKIIERWNTARREITARENDPYYGLSKQEKFTKVKEEKENLVRGQYTKSLNNLVVTPYGTFNGGWESARLLLEVKDLAESLGELNVIITDVDNEPQELSFEECVKVVTAIRKAARTSFTRKQDKMRFLKNAKKLDQLLIIE